jgi:hypothetical protein
MPDPQNDAADIAWLRSLAEEGANTPPQGGSILFAAGLIWGTASLAHWFIISGLIPVDPAGFGLEIGPSHAPVFPKRDGFNVETLDYTDAEGLRAKYANDPNVDLSRIEEPVAV